MKRHDTENYRLRLSIIGQGHQVAEALTEVYLPKRLTDPVTLLFHPDDVVSLAHLFEFSVYGEIKDLSGR
jgi:hypothetical protein